MVVAAADHERQSLEWSTMTTATSVYPVDQSLTSSYYNSTIIKALIVYDLL